MKNIVVALLTLFIIALMIFTAMDDPVFHGGHQARVIGDFTDIKKQEIKKSTLSKEDKRVDELKNRAGNRGAFRVSNEYKSKCASCHGVDASGFQNGRAMMGPALFGRSEDEIYKSLVEFKSGRVENMIMKGLLIHLEDEDLRRISKEIGEFPQRAKE